jgi:hypothetical protein
MLKIAQRTLILMVLITIMLLVSSCAANKMKVSPQVQVENEINKWQSFHMEGMAEVNVSSFAIRKYFICQKYTHSLQFDMVDTGLLGAEPAPLVTIKVDSLLTIDSPYHEVIQRMFAKIGMKQMNLSPYLDFKTLFKDKIPGIVSTQQTIIGNYEFKFNKKMQLIQILSQDKNQNITVQYRKNQPNLIVADIKKLAKVRMQVEQFVNTSCCDSLMNLPQNK